MSSQPSVELLSGPYFEDHRSRWRIPLPAYLPLFFRQRIEMPKNAVRSDWASLLSIDNIHEVDYHRPVLNRFCKGVALT